MTHEDSLTYASEIAEAKKRIGMQAAKRAVANDCDPVAASALAQDLWTSGACHETIIERVCGAYRRRAA